MLLAQRGSFLTKPYDAEVAYLESTGTQWIDTGIHATQNTTAKIKCAWMTTTNDVAVFGADNGNTWTGFLLLQNTGIRFVRGGPTNTFAQRWNQFDAGMMYDIECSQNGVVIDGTLHSFNGTPTSEFYVNKPISLFGWWRTTQPWGANVRIAYVQFFENGTLVRDYIPVRFTNSNGQSEGAMYDRVTKSLLRNAGTGSFTIGQDKIWPNPYVTDGLIGLWDGEWNSSYGLHDSSATVWSDLSGNHRDAVLSGTYSWGSNYWHVESVSGHGLAKWPAQNLGSGQTVEFVIDPIASIGYGRIIAEAAYVASPIVFNGYPGSLYMYGYGLDTACTITDIIPGFDNKGKHLHQIVHPSGGPMKYYIDGILCWSQRTTHDNTGGEHGYFANNTGLNRGIDSDYFTMRRYNRVLTDDELAANRAVDARRFNLSS